MKVLFLDIDGVLNNLEFLRGLTGECTREEHYARQLDPQAVQHLNAIIEATDARVVISSSWRVGNTPGAIARMLRSRGFVGKVIGKTPNHVEKHGTLYAASCRGDEIQAWLTDRDDVEAFVILDDGSDMGHPKDRLVQTSWGAGLRAEHIEPAVAMLSRTA